MDITVKEFITKIKPFLNFAIVGEEDTIEDIVKKMIAKKDDRAVFVQNEKGEIVGVIFLGDLVKHHIYDGVYQNGSPMPSMWIIHHLTAQRAKDIMNKNFLYCNEEEVLIDVLSKMTNHPIIKLIPVLSNEKKLISVISILDIIEYQIENKINRVE